MSHFSNDMIADDVAQHVSLLDDIDVIKALNDKNVSKVAKFTGDKVHGANIIDYARTVLIDQLWDDAMSMPGPHG